MKMKQISIMISLALSLLVIAACKPKAPAAEIPASSDAATTQAPVTPETGYPERAYFGDTHVHTGWSFDAGLDGAVTSPEDAFRLASGAEVTSNSGQMVKLQRPLDWMVITDHSDGMGTINEVQSGNPEMIADPFLNTLYEAMKGNDPKARGAAVLEVINRQSNGNLPKQVMDPKWMVSAWQKTAATADKYNKPGTFTAMIGYECHLSRRCQFRQTDDSVHYFPE
jgi:hypothetical protein